jgi:hypothetical protein
MRPSKFGAGIYRVKEGRGAIRNGLITFRSTSPFTNLYMSVSLVNFATQFPRSSNALINNDPFLSEP